MKCHYEVLEVERTATIDEIKKQYKKLALKLHPDRNIGNEEAATEAFKLVTSAYTVLSDPQERQWYDDHRESILRGGNGTRSGEDEEEYTMNLWPYFSSSCFSGYDDTNDGFYTVYSGVFHRLWRDERDSDGRIDLDEPVFGRLDSSSAEIMRFYNYWTYFTTCRSFSWEDKYNTNDGPNRYVRREMEKENAKIREAAKKAYNSLVQSLVNYLKKRDARMIEIEAENLKRAQEQEQRRLLQRQEMKAKRKEKIAMSRQLLENDEEELERREHERERAFLLADNSDEEVDDVNNDDEELMLQSSMVYDLHVEEADDDQVDEEVFTCEACSKEFKTQLQLNQHLSSKVHRKRVQELEKKEKMSKTSKPKDLHAADASRSKIEKMVHDGSESEQTTFLPLHDEDDRSTSTEPMKNSSYSTGISPEDREKAHVCEVCGWSTPSKNKLFRHLDETGHAQPKTQLSATSVEDHSSTNKSKKSKTKRKVGF